MESVVVRLTPQEWCTAWRPQAKRLVLPLPGAPARRQRIAVRVELAGHILHATVVATVADAKREGTRTRAELEPDAASANAVALLDAAARGQAVHFRDRPKRYLVQLPVTLVGAEAELFMTTQNLSSGGCSLRWSGPPPAVGARILLRFGAGLPKAEVEGTVRWVRSGAGTSVGVRFVDPRSAVLLSGLLDAAIRSKAPTL